YFDKDTGKFLGKGGTDDIRFISSDDWDQGNLENFSMYASNENVEAAVYEYYATTNNLAPENATGCQFCAGLSDGWSTSNYDGVLAFNFSRNSIGPDVLKAQDAINVLVHEIGDGGHGGDFIRGTVKKSGIDANWEMRATNSQVRHSSWHNTSTTLKQLFINTMVNL
ncbi:MAG: hypothetical protein JKY22_02445, partial [Flavobacteriaceae bacterium]|nr:hypothetical protein [Flavobacteriaceae bacterium]